MHNERKARFLAIGSCFSYGASEGKEAAKHKRPSYFPASLPVFPSHPAVSSLGGKSGREVVPSAKGRRGSGSCRPHRPYVTPRRCRSFPSSANRPVSARGHLLQGRLRPPVPVSSGRPPELTLRRGRRSSLLSPVQLFPSGTSSSWRRAGMARRGPQESLPRPARQGIPVPSHSCLAPGRPPSSTHAQFMGSREEERLPIARLRSAENKCVNLQLSLARTPGRRSGARRTGLGKLRLLRALLRGSSAALAPGVVSSGL